MMKIGPDGVKHIYETASGGTEFSLDIDNPYKDGGGKGTTNSTAQFNISYGRGSQLPFTRHTEMNLLFSLPQVVRSTTSQVVSLVEASG
jgi:hypothetical protein